MLDKVAKELSSPFDLVRDCMKFQIDVARAFNDAWTSQNGTNERRQTAETMQRLDHWLCGPTWSPDMPVFSDDLIAACYFTATYPSIG